MPSMRVPRFVGGSKIEFIEKPVPVPGPGELLVRVHANALCGSERGQFRGGSHITPGHEAAGVVAAAGAGTSIVAGTHGVIFLMDFCGECRSCRRGLTNQCFQKRADIGFSHDGGYGTYALIHENIFFPIDPEIPHAEATLLLDIMGTGGHALKRAQALHNDIRSVLIMGAGPIGLGVAAMARLLLPASTPVVIGDIVPYRLKLAERFGAIPVNLTSEQMGAGLKRNGLSGADIAVDTSGKAVARQAALDALAKTGVLVCVGHGEGLAIEISPQLISPERAVLGSEYFCFNELQENLTLLKANRAFLAQLITHRFPVQEIQFAFEQFFAGETGKVIVEQ